MPTLNGDSAVAAMNARATNVPGTCLNTVWQSYGAHPSIGPHAGQYPDAIDGWRYATRKHPGDLNPPAGYPVYFDALPRPRYGGDTNYASGDIVISVGGGRVRCTDGAGAGRMGTMTIAQRAAQIGRVYLGWTEDFLGYDVVTSSTASLGSTPIATNPTVEVDDMKIQMIRTGDGSGSIGTLNLDGTIDGLTGAEYDALNRTGLIDPLHQEGDGTVWNILVARTARLRAQQHGDPAALAQSVAALIVPAVLAGVQANGGASLTQAQVEAAAEAAIRTVFADASK